MVLGSENEMVMEAQMRGRHDGNFPAPPGLVVVYIVTGGLHHRLISISPPGYGGADLMRWFKGPDPVKDFDLHYSEIAATHGATSRTRSHHCFVPFGAGDSTNFWKRGSFRSGSNIGSSRSSAGVSGTF